MEENKELATNQETELTEEGRQEYKEYVDSLYSQIVEKLPLNTENIEGIQYNAYKFKKGVKEGSYVAGLLTALLNTGITPELAMDYVLNMENVRHNQKLQDKINLSNEKIAKIQNVAAQNNSI